MLADHIRTLFAYNVWAWNHVLASLEQLDEAVYKAKRPLFDQTSLHAMFVHCLTAESIWLSRCLGHNPTSMFDPDAYNDVTAVQQHWTAVRDDWANFLRGLTDKELTRIVAYQNTRGDSFSLSLADILQHVINHATEHRSQMTPILFQLGVPTPPLDYMRFRLRP
ncbi:MAG: DinB family protein [Ardenticatenaceae bacterium]|nr:DinB family protein [Ardenticatenaceae bacterium]MCB9443228.1 DinB family protein [Ardenticatenaceae bacterium]